MYPSREISAFGSVALPRGNLSAYNVTFEQCEEPAAHYKRRQEGIVPDVSGSPMSSTTDSRARTHASRKCVYTLFACDERHCVKPAPCIRPLALGITLL